MIQLKSEPLSVDEALLHVRSPEAGGVVVFLGVVRNQSEVGGVSELRYEAYAPMAEREMRRVAERITAELPGVRVSVQHRIGTLAVGEVAVVCAASAPHRAEAFTAARRLIDGIKETVPIWKHELGEGSGQWVGWGDGLT